MGGAAGAAGADTVLAECIQRMSEGLGQGRTLDQTAFAERVEVLGPSGSGNTPPIHHRCLCQGTRVHLG